MNDDYLGLPSPAYYASIERGYEQWELPVPDLATALDKVKERLKRRGISRFEPDGPKRLRPARR
jgi:hypothetical protein